MLANQARAIVWAQWRSTRNHLPRSNRAGAVFAGLISSLWYGLFVYLASIVAFLLSKPQELAFVRSVFANALLLCFLYWQLVPVLMASLGSSLDMRKLLVYPIPKTELFALEVLLRVTSSIEMMLLVTGAVVGLLLNPEVPLLGPSALVAFVVLNLLCSAGIRDLLVRLLVRRYVREVVIFLFVLAAALPQLLLMTGSPVRLKQFFSGPSSAALPWTAAGQLAVGDFSWQALGVLSSWTAAAYLFGRWQFERGLRFDLAEAAASGSSSRSGESRLEWWYRLPGIFFKDPLAVLIEKEFRFLSRAPRFRLVFLMGFSFGMLIWAPIAFGNASTPHSFISENYLTLVSVYALLLLSDALFWNAFGFDRSAVQLYFLAPVRMTTVLVGKNLAAAWFVAVEVAAIASVCAALRLPLTIRQAGEALAVTVVVTLFVLSIGNLSSFYNPRAVNPAKSFRTAVSGRTQAMLLISFPLSLIPALLAYLARYAFATEWAFFGVIAAGGTLGAIVYSYTLESAVQAAQERREQIVAALSLGEGPIEN